jgi:hypothetical protein
MREVRTPEETIIDKALYLALLDLAAHRKGDVVVGNRIKCMKLPFLVEYPMFEDKKKGFNLVFFQYEHGPISKHIYEIWRDLEAVGCIIFREKNWIQLTQDGHNIASTFISEVLEDQRNSYFSERIKEIAKKYGEWGSVTSVVYDMEVYAQELGRYMKVREVPMGVTFTYVLDDEEAATKIYIPPSWLETLAIELNPINVRSITNALEDYRLGKILSHEEVWERV